MSQTHVSERQPRKYSAAWTDDLQRAVLKWFAQHGRDFPWRTTTNPFHVLIAEVLLRQTQAERVVGPYLELIHRYPKPQALADADVEKLQEWFRPIGLVRRADRLVAVAQLIATEWCGLVPNDLNVLLGLPGIGTYSARAILCLGFGARVPMVDEGSGRVLRRLLGLAPKGPAYSDRTLLNIADRIVPDSRTQEFNLGLIDIAAKVCHPRVPSCPKCPLMPFCHYGRTVVPSREHR